MANYNLDLNKIERRIFAVTLPTPPDGDAEADKKILLVRMPKLSDFEKFAKMRASTEKTSIEDAAELLARILSNNKAGKTITPQYIVDTFDLQDIEEFIENLTIFLKGLKSDPN